MVMMVEYIEAKKPFDPTFRLSYKHYSFEDSSLYVRRNSGLEAVTGFFEELEYTRRWGGNRYLNIGLALLAGVPRGEEEATALAVARLKLDNPDLTWEQFLDFAWEVRQRIVDAQRLISATIHAAKKGELLYE